MSHMGPQVDIGEPTEAKPGQILISPGVLMKVENAVQVEPVGEFALKGIRRPLAAYNVVAAASEET
jgi:class 3 adenylate cyclase